MIIIVILGGLGYIAFNYIKNNNIELKKEKTIKEINSHCNELRRMLKIDGESIADSIRQWMKE